MHPLAAFLLGAAVGAAIVMATPVALPELRRHARPTAKAVLKTVLTSVEAARVKAVELAEDAEDLFAEAQSEVAQAAMADRVQTAVSPTESPHKTSGRKPVSKRRVNERRKAVRIGGASKPRKNASEV